MYVHAYEIFFSPGNPAEMFSETYIRIEWVIFSLATMIKFHGAIFAKKSGGLYRILYLAVD